MLRYTRTYLAVQAAGTDQRRGHPKAALHDVRTATRRTRAWAARCAASFSFHAAAGAVLASGAGLPAGARRHYTTPHTAAASRRSHSHACMQQRWWRRTPCLSAWYRRQGRHQRSCPLCLFAERKSEACTQRACNVIDSSSLIATVARRPAPRAHVRLAAARTRRRVACARGTWAPDRSIFHDRPARERSRPRLPETTASLVPEAV
jgi:hypothetical protein